MPGMDGLALARALQARDGRPRVIFTTAYPQYALDAFQVGAADYLLKPFSEERLGQALARLRELTGAPAPQPEPAVMDRIPVEKGSKTLLVQAGDVLYAYAQNEEVWVRLPGKQFLCRRYTLRELEERLVPLGFIRTHRRYLVNLKRVLEVSPLHKTGMTLVVEGARDTEIPVSRNLMPIVKQKLGLARKDPV